MMTDDNEFARYLANYLAVNVMGFISGEWYELNVDRDLLEETIKEFLETLP